MGVSIITLVEIIEFFICVCRYCFDKVKAGGGRKKVEASVPPVHVIRVKEFGYTEKLKLALPTHDLKKFNI